MNASVLSSLPMLERARHCACHVHVTFFSRLFCWYVDGAQQMIFTWTLALARTLKMRLKTSTIEVNARPSGYRILCWRQLRPQVHLLRLKMANETIDTVVRLLHSRSVQNLVLYVDHPDGSICSVY